IKIRFPLFFQAMDLLAKAIQIAETFDNDTLIKEMHQRASSLILESYLETFQAKLDRARRDGKPDEVKNLLLLLDKFKAFCCSEKDKTTIDGFYEMTTNFLNSIPTSQKKQYKPHANILIEGLIGNFTLPSVYPTQRYRQGLKVFRSNFTNIDAKEIRI